MRLNCSVVVPRLSSNEASATAKQTTKGWKRIAQNKATPVAGQTAEAKPGGIASMSPTRPAT